MMMGHETLWNDTDPLGDRRLTYPEYRANLGVDDNKMHIVYRHPRSIQTLTYEALQAARKVPRFPLDTVTLTLIAEGLAICPDGDHAEEVRVVRAVVEGAMEPAELIEIAEGLYGCAMAG